MHTQIHVWKNLKIGNQILKKTEKQPGWSGATAIFGLSWQRQGLFGSGREGLKGG